MRRPLLPCVAVAAFACSIALPLLAAPEQPAESPAPAPAAVDLQVEPIGDGAWWRMVVTNRAGEPVRIAADARLLTLEIHPPDEPDDEAPDAPAERSAKRAASAPGSSGKAKALSKSRAAKPKVVRCQLPANMRPVEIDDDRALVLPPGRAYEEVFEPALYCFGAPAAAAFARGGEVVATLGFSRASERVAKTSKHKGKAPRGPFIAEPTRSPATIAPLTELVAPAVTRPPAPDPAPTAGSAPSDRGAPSDGGDGDDEGAPRLALAAAKFTDAPDASRISLSIWAKNTGRRPLRALLLRDGLTFEVSGPTGTIACGDPRPLRSSPPEAISVVAPGQKLALDVLLGEVCPDGTFNRPGLYRVRARLTAFAGVPSPRSKALWSGTAATDPRAPSLVRVQTGPLPFHAGPPQSSPRN